MSIMAHPCGSCQKGRHAACEEGPSSDVSREILECPCPCGPCALCGLWRMKLKRAGGECLRCRNLGPQEREAVAFARRMKR